jgi:hypothetical protein
MALALSLLTAPSALADEDECSEPAPGSSDEELDALALAEQTGERVEIAGLTDEKTQHFANPDGTLTMETHAVPVRVRSEQGWVDADSTLVATGDGLVRPRAAGMDIASPAVETSRWRGSVSVPTASSSAGPVTFPRPRWTATRPPTPTCCRMWTWC